jgi:GntR family transcriptional regulator
VNHEFLVYSQFYASERDLGSLLKCPLRKLDGQNFKLMIAEELQLPITSISSHARAQALPHEATKIVGVPRGAMGLCVEAIAFSARRAIYLQLFFVPPTKRLLVLSPTLPEISP